MKNKLTLLLLFWEIDEQVNGNGIEDMKSRLRSIQKGENDKFRSCMLRFLVFTYAKLQTLASGIEKGVELNRFFFR